MIQDDEEGPAAAAGWLTAVGYYNLWVEVGCSYYFAADALVQEAGPASSWFYDIIWICLIGVFLSSLYFTGAFFPDKLLLATVGGSGYCTSNGRGAAARFTKFLDFAEEFDVLFVIYFDLLAIGVDVN